MVGADNTSNRTVAEGYVENYATLLRAQWSTSSKRRRRPRLWLWLMLDKSTRVHKELAKMHDRPTIQRKSSVMDKNPEPIFDDHLVSKRHAAGSWQMSPERNLKELRSIEATKPDGESPLAGDWNVKRV